MSLEPDQHLQAELQGFYAQPLPRTATSCGTRGKPRCGYLTELDLDDGSGDQEFAPAVPFVTAFSGIVAAAETIKHLTGVSAGSLQYQFSFQSGRGRRTTRLCPGTCECHEARASRAA
jgi:hypothetical protein